MNRRLKTVLYGVSHEHACGKFESLKRLSDVYDIVAIADDRSRSTIRFLDQRIDVDKAAKDGFRILSEPEARALADIDVVFVETANGDLMDIASYYVERGVALHCDKPCGETMEPYRTLVEECRQKNLPFQIGYMYRGNPAIRWIFENVPKGLLGNVTFIEADMNHDYGAEGYAEYIASFKGGIFYNLACHLVDMILPLARGNFVSATTRICDAPGDPAGSKTAATAFLRFGGTDVLLRTSAHMPGGILSRRLRVDGTNGTLDLCPIERFDGGVLELTLTLKEPRCGCKAGQSKVAFGVQSDRYADQLLDLAAVVRGDKANDQDYDRDLKVHEILLEVCGANLVER